VTETVQVDPGISVSWQSCVSENPPLADSLNPFNGLPPKLAIVMVWTEPVVPTFCENVNVGGNKLIADGRGLGRDIGVAPKT
jgi:hypothetical protein